MVGAPKLTGRTSRPEDVKGRVKIVTAHKQSRKMKIEVKLYSLRPTECQSSRCMLKGRRVLLIRQFDMTERFLPQGSDWWMEQTANPGISARPFYVAAAHG